MKLIITFTFCCDNLSKSIVYGCGKSLENLGGGIFSPTFCLACEVYLSAIGASLPFMFSMMTFW